MKRISVSQIIKFHQKITEQTGGSPGIRELSLIESALNLIRHSMVMIGWKQTYRGSCNVTITPTKWN